MYSILAASNVTSNGTTKLDTIYVIVVIVSSTVMLYFSIKKNRKNSRKDVEDAIASRVIEETKHDITEAVKTAVVVEVKEAIAGLDYKITQNGGTSQNLGDVAARTEETVKNVAFNLNKLTKLVEENNNKLVEHLGWHHGHEDGKLRSRASDSI